MLIIHIYLFMFVVTVVHMAYTQGLMVARQAKFLPQQMPMVNWFNMLIGGVLWFGYWVSLLSRWQVRSETPQVAARNLGLFEAMIAQIPQN
jgi:hypothetical protein